MQTINSWSSEGGLACFQMEVVKEQQGFGIGWLPLQGHAIKLWLFALIINNPVVGGLGSRSGRMESGTHHSLRQQSYPEFGFSASAPWRAVLQLQSSNYLMIQPSWDVRAPQIFDSSAKRLIYWKLMNSQLWFDLNCAWFWVICSLSYFHPPSKILLIIKH